MVAQTYDGGEFIAVSAADINMNFESFLEQLLPTSNSQLSLSLSPSGDSETLSKPIYYFEDNDLSTVNIRWKCGEQIYITTCLVSENKGIVYDNFLYFIAFPFEIENKLREIPLIKTRSESGTATSIRYEFSRSDKGYNYLGVEVWSYELYCNVTGTKTEKGNSITDMSMNASHDSAVGWSCDARIQDTMYRTGVNGCLKFAWGYCYGAGFKASLSWNGATFSFSGGDHGSSGTEYVSPSELQ